MKLIIMFLIDGVVVLFFFYFNAVTLRIMDELINNNDDCEETIAETSVNSSNCDCDSESIAKINLLP